MTDHQVTGIMIGMLLSAACMAPTIWQAAAAILLASFLAHFISKNISPANHTPDPITTPPVDGGGDGA